MKRLLCLLLLAGCPAEESPDPERAEWPPPTELGSDRVAPLVVPDAYDGVEARPLVVVLGGYANLASDLDDWLGFSARSDDRGHFTLLPDGTIDDDGEPFWNATDTCCDWYGSGVDDVGFLTDLIAEAEARLAVSRVILAGHSNGGFMAYRMACEADSPVDAVLSLAGSSWRDADHCAATHPVRVLQAHGRLDDVMPIDGDATAPSAAEVVRRWADRAGCTGDLEADPARREYVDDAEDDETTVARYSGCDDAVELWTLGDSDHYPETRPAFTDAALDLLLAP